MVCTISSTCQLSNDKQISLHLSIDLLATKIAAHKKNMILVVFQPVRFLINAGDIANLLLTVLLLNENGLVKGHDWHVYPVSVNWNIFGSCISRTSRLSMCVLMKFI